LHYEVLGDMLDEGADNAYIQALFLFAHNDWYWSLLLQLIILMMPQNFVDYE